MDFRPIRGPSSLHHYIQHFSSSLQVCVCIQLARPVGRHCPSPVESVECIRRRRRRRRKRKKLCVSVREREEVQHQQHFNIIHYDGPTQCFTKSIRQFHPSLSLGISSHMYVWRNCAPTRRRLQKTIIPCSADVPFILFFFLFGYGVIDQALVFPPPTWNIPSCTVYIQYIEAAIPICNSLRTMLFVFFVFLL